MLKELWLAYEGGGSRTRLVLADPNGNVYARAEGGPSSPLYRHRPGYAREITSLLSRMKRAAAAAEGKAAVVAVAGPSDLPLIIRTAHRLLRCRKVVVVPEAEVALALYGLRYGVSMVAGTGSSCCAKNEQGQWASCGGYGPQFSDEGSGYWISREAIAAIIRAEQGRGPATALRDKLLCYLEIKDVRDITRLYECNGHMFSPRVAGFAPWVVEAAREGDATARKICGAAGKHLGEMIVVASRRADIRTRPIPVIPTGGVFHAGNLILTPMKRALRESGGEFQVYPPCPEPMPGILKFLQKQRSGVTKT